MEAVFTYIVSLIVVVLSVFITLYFKSELERMFREKKEIFAFHICNVLITLMISFAAYAVMTIYIMGYEFKLSFLLVKLVILLCIILPIYIFGHFSFKKYKSNTRKYEITGEGKVLVINEKYLKRKKGI